ncbi:MAG: SDR family NAD(P)-dependent oxidoreductase, partial [Acidobacteriaceae bacterium]|nr:SDR family NAD(P)-dependent oxidoreductase [Acidobacteriaceae bacterium]
MNWFVTGASSGLGREIAREALERGHRVAMAVRNQARFAESARAFGDRSLVLQMDVTDTGAVRAAMARTRE